MFIFQGSPDRQTLPVDVGSLHEKLANIVKTCDQALDNRTEIIEWFDGITSQRVRFWIPLLMASRVQK